MRKSYEVGISPKINLCVLAQT
ncbi:hypothetical protein [Escherichia coli]